MRRTEFAESSRVSAKRTEVAGGRRVSAEQRGKIVIPFQVAYLRNAGKLMNCLLRRLSALGLVPRFEYNTPLKEMCLLQANKPPAAAGITSKQRLAFASARPTARPRVQKVEHDQSKNSADKNRGDKKESGRQ